MVASLQGRAGEVIPDDAEFGGELIMSFFSGQHLASEARVEVYPVRVVPFKQIDFPVSFPFLELFFAAKCHRPDFVGFKPNEPVDLVPFREAGNETVLVLPNTPREIGSHAGVKCSLLLLARR
jgi:hypothetical protein